MATSEQKLGQSQVVNLTEEHYEQESLWRNALRRLLRNRMALIGLIIIAFFAILAIFAEQLAPHSYRTQTLAQANAAPPWVISLFPTMVSVEDGGYVKVVPASEYLFGTDKLGRDILSRIIYGTRVSLMVALVGPFVAILVGLILGVTAGFVGGKVDNAIMRFTDIMYAFPTLLLIILLMSFFRSSMGKIPEGTIAYSISQVDQASGGMLFIFIGIGLTSWMQMARLARGQVLSVREMEYITAAESIGSPNLPIMWRHVLPNILGPIVVAETLTIPRYISYEAFLSFIGLGVNAPTPSWGAMISEGSASITTYPHQALFPAIALFLIMFAFNFLGDGLRDALDPRMRGID